MAQVINETAYMLALSKVLRIESSRIFILTNSQVLASQQQNYQVTVMNSRYYVYDTLVTPNGADDTTRPIDLLNVFKNDENAKNMLLEFMPDYIKTYKSTVREIFNTVPRIRVPIQIVSKTYEAVTCSVAFWGRVFVHAVILQNVTGKPLSSQIIGGLDQNNDPVTIQHHINVTSDNSGLANFTFTLLSDNATYSIFVSAENPLPFLPRLSLPDDKVLTISLRTPINPNLQKNKNEAVAAVREQNPEMAKEVEKMNRFSEAQSKIHGIDKTTKDRQH
jgi:hypothetical protein